MTTTNDDDKSQKSHTITVSFNKFLLSLCVVNSDFCLVNQSFCLPHLYDALYENTGQPFYYSQLDLTNYNNLDCDSIEPKPESSLIRGRSFCGWQQQTRVDLCNLLWLCTLPTNISNALKPNNLYSNTVLKYEHRVDKSRCKHVGGFVKISSSSGSRSVVWSREIKSRQRKAPKTG